MLCPPLGQRLVFFLFFFLIVWTSVFAYRLYIEVHYDLLQVCAHTSIYSLFQHLMRSPCQGSMFDWIQCLAFALPLHRYHGDKTFVCPTAPSFVIPENATAIFVALVRLQLLWWWWWWWYQQLKWMSECCNRSHLSVCWVVLSSGSLHQTSICGRMRFRDVVPSWSLGLPMRWTVYQQRLWTPRLATPSWLNTIQLSLYYHNLSNLNSRFCFKNF